MIIRNLLLGAGLAVVLAASATAQNGPPPGPPPAPPSAAQMSDHFRQSLHLRADQEGALQAYVAALQLSNRETIAGREKSAGMQSLPTPQRLDAMLARFDSMRAMLVEMATATKAFYAQLTPEQRATFDRGGS